MLQNNIFMTARLFFWKSDNSVSSVLGSWKNFGLLVIIKSVLSWVYRIFETSLICENTFATLDLTKNFHGNIIRFYTEMARKIISFHIALAANLNFWQYNLSDYSC